LITLKKNPSIKIINQSINHVFFYQTRQKISCGIIFVGCFRIRKKLILGVSIVNAGTQMKECLLLCENYFFIGLQVYIHIITYLKASSLDYRYIHTVTFVRPPLDIVLSFVYLSVLYQAICINLCVKKSLKIPKW
jgi:hypothetical protein